MEERGNRFSLLSCSMFGASEWPEAGALLGAWNFIELNWKTLVFGQQGFSLCA